MGRFRAVIRLIIERLEALSLRKEIAALCILTAVTMFSFAAPFAINFSYAANTVEGQTEAQDVTQSGEDTGSGNETQNNAGNEENGSTGEGGTAEGDSDPQANNSQELTELVEQLKAISGVTVDDSLSELTIIDNAGLALIILSNSDASLYQNTNISINQAGQVGLINDNGQTFKGLGSADYPYSGKLTSTVAFNINRPLFNAVILGDDDYSYTLNWGASNSKDAMFAGSVQGEAKTLLTLTIMASTQTIGSHKYVIINSPVIGEASGNIALDVTYNSSEADKFKVGITSGTSPDNNETGPDAGLLVNTFKDGLLEISLSGITYDEVEIDEVEINSERANAGLIVGRVYSTPEFKSSDNKAKVTLNSTIKIKNSDSAEINAKKSAGGLIGHAEDSIITINSNNVDLSHVKVKGLYSGGFVGVSTNSEYTISENANIKSSLSVGGYDVSSQYAGGLFGVYETSSDDLFPIDKFDLTGSFVLEAIDQTSGEIGAAGGFAGKVILRDSGCLSISMPESSSPASEENNNSSPEGETQTLSESENSSDTDNNESTTNESESSGLFESITSLAEEAGKVKPGLKSVLNSAPKTDSSEESSNVPYLSAYGGVIGTVEGAENLATNVKLENMKVWAECAETSKALFKSGMIAIVGGTNKPTALVVSKTTTTMTNADSSNAKTGAFGGIAAKLGKGSVIYQAGKTVVSTEGTAVNAGGGIVGIAEAGSAVRLTGITDISGVSFADAGARIGQLVGIQDSSLVYADGSGSDFNSDDGTGWDYIRSGRAQFDDIGNYGQVYRIGTNLIKMDEQTYQVSLAKSENTYKSDPNTVNEGSAEGSEEGNQTEGTASETGTGDPAQSAEGEPSAIAEGASGSAVDVEILGLADFARLAITIQTEGYFSGYDTIDTRNWEILLNDTLTFKDSINLEGTGITGITRDSISAGETPAVFTGTIKGGDNTITITLSIGEAYGMMKSALGDTSPVSSADGCGKVYRHNRLGLFSYGNGSAEKLIIIGKINFKALEAGIAAGAYSACSNGGVKTFTGCSFEPEITYKTNEKLCCVGGVIGMLDGEDSNITTFEGQTRIAPTIKIDAVSTTGVDITGGAIGYIGGNCSAEVNAEDVVLGATISNAEQSNNNSTALAGGYIGVIQTSDQAALYDRVKVNFKKAVMDGQSVSLKADNYAGGLLGYLWADTNVNFNPGTSENAALSVKSDSTASLNAVSKYAGGLVYRAAGKWTIHQKGINLDRTEFAGTTDTLGLLVCRGVYYGAEKISGKDKYPGAIYLEMADKDSLLIPDGSGMVNCNPKNFDELVAITKNLGNYPNNSFNNNIAGIISIKADVNDSTIETYQNRTAYGKKDKKSNEYSRYYYNLDSALKDVVKQQDSTNNGVIDTPEELLIWSVATYSATNLKSYFTDADNSDIKSADGDIVIGTADVSSAVEAAEGEAGGTVEENSSSLADEKVTINMAGYSYYPVTVNNRNITIKNARIEFHNDEQETKINGTNDNKSTRANTQHCAMQCGLFCDFTSSKAYDYSIDCSNIAFAGNVGIFKRNNDPMSGVLICGYVMGNQQASNTYYCKTNITNCTLDGIVVSGHYEDGYAPLLLKDAKSFTEISIDELSTSTEKYKNSKGEYIIAGTSLLGNIGDKDATLLSVTFSRISIPSKKNDNDKEKIFSRASLLNRFSYTGNNGVATATYNFTKDDQNEGKVTFGAEIDGSKEYSGEQSCYYKTEDKTTVGTIVADDDNPKFPDRYLPYVYEAYNTVKSTHEIEVNHSFSDILTGCGTYYDPYVVKDFSELKTIARLIRNGKTGENQKVTIAKNQKEACNRKISSNDTSNEVTYTYNKGKWVNDSNETVDREVIQRYMQSAYIDICPDSKNLGLTNFEGFGNMANPFRGVIISSNKTAINMYIDGKSCQGFIPYSYGSVVKDITINYSGDNKISYVNPDVFAPKSFFGGVIGIIMGGDNIIENVDVSVSEPFLNVNSDKNYKIPIGGYVGAISGGGVIFRGNNEGALEDSWFRSSGLSAAEDAYKSLYVNPIVGRVISGYAFSEGIVGNNNNKNYKINEITSEPEAIKTSTVKKAANGPMTTTVKSAQGLLILSAIIQSGAAGGPADCYTNSKFCATNAYYGQNIKLGKYQFGNANLGKVRNATYAHIGKPDEDDLEKDFKESIDDDLYAPGIITEKSLTESEAFTQITTDGTLVPKSNAPYLITKYATPQTQYICGYGISLAKFEFSASEYYMKDYGNAYVGLSGRYKSNSCASLNSDAIDRVVPYVICVDGKNATIKVDMKVREYSDDDFQCSGTGALFSSMYWMYSTSTSINTAFSDNGKNAIKDLKIANSHISVDYYSSAGEITTFNFAEGDNKASVGGVAGRISHVTNGFASYPVLTMSNVDVSGSTIEGPISAGSLIGETGYREKNFSDNKSIGNKNSTGIRLSFHLLDCSYSNNKVTAGQYAGGYIGRASGYNNNNYVPGSGITVTNSGLVCGRNTSIDANTSAGGIVGTLDGPGKFVVNDQTYRITDNAGNNEYYSNEGKQLETAKFEDVRVSSDKGVSGGLIGKASSYVSVNDSVVRKQKDSFTITTGTTGETFNVEMIGSYSGGLVGTINNSTVAEIKNNVINSCTVEGLKFTTKNSGTGGLVGIITDNSSSAETLNIIDSKVKGCLFGNNNDAAESISGGAIGIIHDKNIQTNVKNSASIGNTITGKNSSAFVGIGRGSIEGCNVLIDGNTFDTSRTDQGLVAGSVVDGGTVRIAGLSIKKTGNSDNDIDKLYGDGITPSNSYLAFANYNGNTGPSGKTLLGASESWPYVATSPVTDYCVKAPLESSKKYLFGDGIGTVDAGGKPHSEAETIVSEAKSEDSGGKKYKYNNSKSQDYIINFAQQISTYNENNASNKMENDMPVLTITGGNADVIEKYLNIITNGGYKDAKSLGRVLADISTYEWKNGSFIKSQKPQGETSSILVRNSGSRNMSFSATADYDNDQGRVQLLTVTFSEAGGGEYKIHVPIIVKRIFEVDSTVTLNYGTVFQQSVYDKLGEKAHVLESFGNPVTALITYKYNSAIGERTEYGWDTYLLAGGTLLDAEKTIEFSGNDAALPGGTKLSLVDCGTGKVYTYTTPEGNKTSKVSLSSFKDSDGKNYNDKWMSQLMSITGQEDNNGIWVICEDQEEPAAVDSLGRKFRLATEEDSAKQKYNLISDKDSVSESKVEMQAEENFFLTINIPYQNNQDASANGFIKANVKSKGIPISVNSILRPLEKNTNKTLVDSHDQTASTYSFLSGYSQTLVDETTDYKDDNRKQIPSQKGDDTPGRFININLKDTISFNSDQAYNANDTLFYRLDINLNQFSLNGASQVTSGFATTDTEGEVKFYVTVEGVEGTYYVYNDGAWSATSSKKAASSYTWESSQENGGEPKLVLKDSNGAAIDLSGIREIASNKNAKFIIRTEMEVHMSEEATNEAIMSSLNSGNDAYTNLNYKGILSVREEALDYSSNNESITGKVDYYHSSWGYSTIAYSANDIKQLGINCLDLETADGNIITTGVYSLEDRANVDTITELASRIEYSLQLMKKQESGEYVLVNNPGDYVSVDCSKLGGAPSAEPSESNNYSFIWEDKKSNDSFKLADDDSNKRFTISIHAKVNTSQRDLANYRLVLSAKMYDSNGNLLDNPYRSSLKGSNNNEISDEVVNHYDYVTYTLTKIAIDGLIEDPSN